jgi:hypothetical protein
LGRDPDIVDPYDAPPKARTPLPPQPKPKWIETGTSELVLFVGEAAQRLDFSDPRLSVATRPGSMGADRRPSSDAR